MQTAVEIIEAARLPSGSEKEVQVDIADVLTAAGIAYEREVRLAPGDIIDFVVGSTGIEIKIKGSRRAILRQLERYASHESLKELVLVSFVAIGLPKSISGKPVRLVSMGRAWL